MSFLNIKYDDEYYIAEYNQVSGVADRDGFMK